MDFLGLFPGGRGMEEREARAAAAKNKRAEPGKTVKNEGRLCYNEKYNFLRQE